jgi:hypothetical protein
MLPAFVHMASSVATLVSWFGFHGGKAPISTSFPFGERAVLQINPNIKSFHINK